MTERGADKVIREENSLSIGPSSIFWRGDVLEIELDEICAPLPKRIRGRVRLWPTTLCEHRYTLGDSGRHAWCPFAPCARIEVELSKPRQNWRGIGYLDGNFGDEPARERFRVWNWSRASSRDGTVVLYDYRTRKAVPQARCLEPAPRPAKRRSHYALIRTAVSRRIVAAAPCATTHDRLGRATVYAR